jgi:crotonobetainyl-CoA:carnitine CoA-transferase CaiB-like acyl-CoA transferase
MGGSDRRMTGGKRLRVIDFSMGWAGPLLGQMLAEMGAEVVKVEDTRRFDWWRGSLTIAPPEMQPIERSPLFNSVNRNKLGVTLDLKDPRGRALVRRLIERADVAIENFSPGVMERLGLGYAALSRINPGLVMVSLPSFGSEGPECHGHGYGMTVEAMAGITALTGYHDGGQPYALSNALGDPIGGLNGMFAVLVALRERERNGHGQAIEIAQVEAAIPFIADAVLDYQFTGCVPRPRGNRHPTLAPHGVYRCAGPDCWLALCARTEAQWQSLLSVLGLNHLGVDPRFANQAARKGNEDALDAELARALRDQNLEQIALRLSEAGVPAGQVNPASDVLSDRQLLARRFFVAIDRAVVGPHLYPGAVARFSQTPLLAERPAPLLGEHNRTVLGEMLGMTEDEIDALERDNVIGTKPRE